MTMSTWARHGALLSALCVGGALLFTGPVSTQGPFPRRPSTFIGGFEAVGDEVVVKYREGAAARSQFESQLNVTLAESFGRAGARRLRSGGLGTAQLIERLRLDPDVEYVEPNYIVRRTVLPDDPSFGALWGLLNTGFNSIGGGGTAGADIDAPSAWNRTIGTRANVVGVIDTGIDYNHPDLSANMWSAPAQFTVSIGGQSITCQAGTHGFNAINRTCNPMDDGVTPHGTHVAGTIGATGNNGTGVVGVNWVASMMGLKFLNQDGYGNTVDAINAIEFAIQAKAAFASTSGANVRILSNSWGGGGYSQALVDEIHAANANAMLFVAAAGNSHSNNDTSPSYPASYNPPNVLAVAASTNTDGIASFSNYGATSVHVAAPGVSIYSTGKNNTYLTLSGTSMATPQVSGAAALVISMCSATTAELRALLVNTVDTKSGLSGLVSTGGRINVARAVNACTRPLVSGVTVSANKTAPQGVGTAVAFTAAGGGGQAPYQYRWFVWDGSVWTGMTAWSTSSAFTWTPTSANTAYQVRAAARSAWNTGLSEGIGTVPFAIQPAVSAVAVSANKTAPQGAGTAITFTAGASGGQAPYQYRWFVWDGTAWTGMTAWSTGNTFTWTPTAANPAYEVRAAARSAWNTGLNEAWGTVPFAIQPVVSAVAVSANKTAPQSPGTGITFTAGASGGQAPYQYRWFVWDGATWTGMTAWSTANTFAWTPGSPNSSYQVRAAARSAWNTGLSEGIGTVPFAIQ